MSAELEAITQYVMEIFDSEDARDWMSEYRRPEIEADHFPLGWVPIAAKDALWTLIDRGEVHIEEHERRFGILTERARFASFLVKGPAK